MQAKTVLVNAGTVLRYPRKVCGYEWMYRGNRPFYAGAAISQQAVQVVLLMKEKK